MSVLLVAVGLYLTNNFNRDQIRLQRDSTNAQRDLALKGQRADRFVAAVDQLGQEGTDRLSIRLGGIYALETLMKDSPEDENTVIEVLCAFVRTHSPRPRTIPRQVPDSPADVRAAISVLGRRPNPYSHAYLDFRNALLGLHDADLQGADLSGTNLADANLTGAFVIGANLRFVSLTDANLTGAFLTDANLTDANLAGANLTDAGLNKTYLTRTKLINANLTGAALYLAKLTEANLAGANLTGATLFYADLTNANLTGAKLTRANLTGANLTRANLTSGQVACSRMDASTRLPNGVVRPAEGAWNSTECKNK
ncbi:uncharacterized protein YjbI with pentapeptide repeats [Actinoplanes tereljensis]|uniref:Pentapeptide repeat-containing protein n=1 Tax=Paractinoplanes tereljensis TaxID=571912 RepID=A0A919NV26_9ACTN|nr:pentapeptide repeat-containing protein [Actinoplanes tereljensis]GIF25801.1 hypothetical protein Ate02nite_85310 [Actinoplanes tereljensis]